MTGFDGIELQPPTDWQKFERLCCDLWAEIWADPDAKLNGRSGQPQAGVDIYGYSKAHGGLSGVQCKKRDNNPDPAEITDIELRAEVEKAKTFNPPLTGQFVLAFTGKRDAKIQEVARVINVEHAEKGLFKVDVYSWDDIQHKLGEHIGVWARHYSHLIAAVDYLRQQLPSLSTNDGHEPAGAVVVSQSKAQILIPREVDQHSPLDAEHRSEIQMIRELLSDGHPSKALEMAERLRTRIWGAASNGVRARLVVLVGHVLLDLGRIEDAARELVSAASYAPAESAIQAQIALGHSLADSLEAARNWSRKSLDQDPTNIVAVQVAVLHDTRPDSEVLQEHERNIGVRAELYAALGNRAAQSGEAATALTWFEKALEKGRSHGDIVAVTGQVIIDCVNLRLSTKCYIDATDKDDLAKAVSLLDEAIGQLRDEQARQSRPSWYVALVTAKRLLHANDVVRATELALQACGPHIDLRLLRAAVAADAEDYHTVIEIIENLPEPRTVDDIGLLAAAFGNTGRHERSAQCFLDLLSREDLPEQLRHSAGRNYAFALYLQNRGEEAERYVESALTAVPSNLSPILWAIELSERLSNTTRRDKLLADGVALAASAPTFLRLVLGDALMRAGWWSQAADVYGLDVRPSAGDVYGRRLLHSVYSAGRFETLLRTCATIESREGASSFLTEMRSCTFEALGDLEQARRTCCDFLGRHPDDWAVRVRLAFILRRQGHLDQGVEELRKVSLDNITDLETAMACAQMLAEAGSTIDSLELAYRARNRHRSQPSAHIGYLTFFTNFGRRLPDSEEVKVSTAVHLTGVGAPGWILISESETTDESNKVYARNHDLSVKLIGRHVGDEIEVSGGQTSWKVEAIGTKYAFAYIQTLEVFPARFPTSGALEHHEAPKDPNLLIDQIKNRLKQSNPQHEAALAQYAAGRCTVGCIAAALHRTQLEAMSLLLNSPGGLVCTTNTPQERDECLSILSDGQRSVVLDLLGILTLDTLGALRSRELAGRRWMIAQSTLDVLHSEESRWKARSNEESMSLGFDGEQLIRYVSSAEDSAAVSKYFEDLQTWLRAQAEVQPVSPTLAEETTKSGNFGNLLGQCSSDSLLIAKAQNALLLSDDAWLRRFGKVVLNVDGTSSDMLLWSEVAKGHFSPERYADCVTRLIEMGYRSLPVNALVLTTAAQRTQWRPGSALDKVLRMLGGTESEPESALRVGAEFIRVIWLNVVVPQQRTTLLLSVLDALATGRRKEFVIARLTTHLEALLYLLPLAAKEMGATIIGWDKMRIVL